jgi:hypothetical protein
MSRKLRKKYDELQSNRKLAKDSDPKITEIKENSKKGTENIQITVNSNNISSQARKMMEKMGWSEGKGLGKDETGIAAPVNIYLDNLMT